MSAAWSSDRWAAMDRRIERELRAGNSTASARGAREILRSYSSSFFLVTRFLPPATRAKVETIYAAVRYPDEIVDTFPLAPRDKYARLKSWEASYREALELPVVRARVEAGIPWILCGFAEVVRQDEIPVHHYGSFIDAMRRDVEPRPFQTLDELIDGYVYGSAIVVGYFLAHVYKPAPGVPFRRTRDAAETLGIALQLTNFCRDVAEDRARGRMYLPQRLIQAHGVEGAVQVVAREAASRYDEAARTLEVYSEETRPAIRACIEVYRALNTRIIESGGDTRVRHSVPIRQKFEALPRDKYWRVPLALVGAL